MPHPLAVEDRGIPQSPAVVEKFPGFPVRRLLLEAGLLEGGHQVQDQGLERGVKTLAGGRRADGQNPFQRTAVS